MLSSGIYQPYLSAWSDLDVLFCSFFSSAINSAPQWTGHWNKGTWWCPWIIEGSNLSGYFWSSLCANHRVLDGPCVMENKTGVGNAITFCSGECLSSLDSTPAWSNTKCWPESWWHFTCVSAINWLRHVLVSTSFPKSLSADEKKNPPRYQQMQLEVTLSRVSSLPFKSKLKPTRRRNTPRTGSSIKLSHFSWFSINRYILWVIWNYNPGCLLLVFIYCDR